jgi:serralysin
MDGSAFCTCPICGGNPSEPQYAGDGSGGFTGTKPVWSLQQIVSNLVRWDARWAPAPISYSFYGGTPAHLAAKSDWKGFVSFTAEQRDATRLALGLISDLTGLQFVEKADDGSQPGLANPRLTFSTSLSTEQYFTAYAMVEYTDGQDLGDAHRIHTGELMFNGHRWNGSMAPGFRPFSVLMHEIMHGLGLSHPGAYNRNPGEEITYGKHAEYTQDSGQFTVMSYFGAVETGSVHTSYADTPLLHDIAALQSLYGANMSTRAGNTVYGYNSTAGRASYDFNLNPTPIFTIWDGGGIDTLDFTQTTYAVNLNLNAGAFSDAFQMTNNISIAFGVVVENAKGGSAADYMMGNAAANRLEGLGGDDSLWGADGDDKLFGGDGSDVLVGQAGDDELWGGAGRDLLYGWSGTDILVGEAGDDELWGGEGRDFLYGWSGADTLIGQDGDDELWGGEDNDVLWGWAGRDLLIGQEGDDQLWGGEDNDSLWGWSGNDILVGGTGNDDLWGGEGRDFLYGWQDDDTLVGGDGDDELWGGEGRDFLYGWQGSDVLIGNDGDDELWGGEGRDFLYGWTGSDVLIGNDGDDELWGGEDGDFLYGWTGGDYLIGGEGNDELWGGEDNDRLFGGSGADKLVGGTGADVFVFHGLADSAPTASDRIWDFSSAEGDIVDLALIDANSSLAGDQAFSLVSAFSGQAGQATLTFNAAGNTSTLNLDVNGDGQADFTLLFTGQVGTTGWLW